MTSSPASPDRPPRLPELYPQYVDLLGPAHATPVARAARAFLAGRDLVLRREAVLADVGWTLAGSMALLELLCDGVNDAAECFALAALGAGLPPLYRALDGMGCVVVYREEVGVRQVLLAALPEDDAEALRQIARDVYEAVSAVPGLLGGAAPPALERVRCGALAYRHLAEPCRQAGEPEVAGVLERSAAVMLDRVREAEDFFGVQPKMLPAPGEADRA